MQHAALVEPAGSAHGKQCFLQAQRVSDTCVDRVVVDEACAERLFRCAERPPLWPQQQRLAGHQRGRTVPHRSPDDEASLNDELRLDAEEPRPPQHHVRHLALLKRADIRVYTEGACGVDGVFRDIALDPLVVAEAPVFSSGNGPR